MARRAEEPRFLCRWSWASVVVLVMCAVACRGAQRVNPHANRYVSLSPAITETLFAIGAGPLVVGVSDYCHFPRAVERLPHLGSGYTPRHESIVALQPTAVFVEAVNAQTSSELGRVLHVEVLPWLTLEQVAASTRSLGRLTHYIDAAEHLARSYEETTRPNVSAASPRVLLVLAHSPGQLNEVWFIRRNSIHGRLLEAAGANNAVPDEISGPPHLSLEEVIRLDPDGVIILQSAVQGDPRLVKDWTELRVLKAVKNRRVELIASLELTIPGPRLLALVRLLSPLVQAWSGRP
jgi:iron complex transport system substrate-binding protein